MSTVYMFADLRVRRAAQRMNDFLAMEKKALSERVAAFAAAREIPASILEEIQDRIQFSSLYSPVSSDADEYIIGTSYSKGFVWRADNSFCSIADIQRFLDSHPDFVIIDEYGEHISIDKLQRISLK